jgi:hypothetical protein
MDMNLEVAVPNFLESKTHKNHFSINTYIVAVSNSLACKTHKSSLYYTFNNIIILIVIFAAIENE